MLFDRYKNNNSNTNKSKSTKNEKSIPTKKLSLANSLFKRLPFNFYSTFNSNNNNHDKKKYQSKKYDTKNITSTHQPPRSSISLPNIVSTKNTENRPPIVTPDKHACAPISSSISTPHNIASSQLNIKQRKRYSAEQRHQHRHQWVSVQEVNRHSFTFGHLPSTKNLTLENLFLPLEQLATLEKLIANHSSITDEELLARLGSTTNQNSLVPHRSISHQHLSISSSFQRKMLNRTHSESHKKRIDLNKIRLKPEELIQMLSDDGDSDSNKNVLLIDVRNLVDYQKQRIRNSINVNLPSLLIKRYQRGTVSNFNLENFITTVEGRETYQLHKQQTKDITSSLLSTLHEHSFSTLLEQKALEAELQMKTKKNKSNNRMKIWVVYDQDMPENDQSSQAWTLLSVLERLCLDGKSKVYYLYGGFQEFQKAPLHESWIISSNLHEPLTGTLRPNTDNNYGPRRSISYTLGESKNDVDNKRASLFTLDTQAARINNANALARKAKRRSQKLLLNNNNSLLPSSNYHTNSTITKPTTTTTTTQTYSFLQQEEGQVYKNSIRAHSSLNQVAEDDEILTADISPCTETDFDFVISDVIPGFLFVGPEIETDEQANQLVQVRQIKRVLNMAEECDDKGLMLVRDRLIYHKIAARDTLEMKNIEHVMMEAVSFIEEAKKNHEPIYVHCKAGKSRSITAILAYLVTSERWTLKRAYQHVIKARPNMSPNIGFITELMKMEGKVHGSVSSFLESSDWQTTSLPSPEYLKELNQLENAWRTEK
ncbi:uncharacterized protein BX663DRAFT_494256 [Cokeromyces recurvatus]|uniref:uncharacterized protein n=1 Tax=Cokeromyces recurvatus TaxID=90255 RepID=UPI00221E8FD1|nr:uncharacterized protein BX663DRAFT_494256 [Cokeromyces recurvatus]KAI7906934.1 hypothetical protein BX663DRAFT_494256 [Cokeromyces recurvatus]